MSHSWMLGPCDGMIFNWSSANPRILGSKFKSRYSAPEINVSPVPDIVYGSWHFVTVTRNACLSSVYELLLKFKNLLVIVTGRKGMLSVTYEIVPDSDWWPAVILCTVVSLLERAVKKVSFEKFQSSERHNNVFCLWNRQMDISFEKNINSLFQNKFHNMKNGAIQ